MRLHLQKQWQRRRSSPVHTKENSLDTQSKTDQPTQGKTTYQSPEIIDYGDIETLTQAGNGTVTDADGGVSVLPG